MPFTGSHPAAVLPLLRTRLPPAALVIGSMAPDLPLFVPVRFGAELSHRAVGAVTVDLLYGLVLFTLWRALLAPAVVVYAPRRLRLRPYHRGVERPQWIVLGLVIGALTHIGWDGFTHGGGWAVRRLPVLSVDLGPWPAYKWAQYAGGVVGALLIAGWWWRTRRPDPEPAAPAPPGRAPVYALILLAAAAGAAYGTWFGWRPPHSLQSAAFYATTLGIDAGAAIALGVAVVHTVRARDRPAIRRG